MGNVSKKQLKQAESYIKSRKLPLSELIKLKDVLGTDEYLHISDVLPVIEMLLNDDFEEFQKELERCKYFELKKEIAPKTLTIQNARKAERAYKKLINTLENC